MPKPSIFTKDQQANLEAFYKQNSLPTQEDKIRLAREFNKMGNTQFTELQINNWFQNQRNRIKAKKLAVERLNAGNAYQANSSTPSTSSAGTRSHADKGVQTTNTPESDEDGVGEVSEEVEL